MRAVAAGQEEAEVDRPGAQLVAGGLSEREAARRRAAGRGNTDGHRTSRRTVDILRANVCTRFNGILGALLVVILVVGPIQDALFGIVLVANALVGIVQELRAKRALDRLAVVTTPRVAAVRDGRTRLVPPDEIVEGDVIACGAGDQIVADGPLVSGHHLEVDESLLTGESAPVRKAVGDPLLSGSFVVAGDGRYLASSVGPAAFAHRLAAEAKHLELAKSELRQGIDRILQVVTWVIVPVGALLVGTRIAGDEPWDDAVRGSVAGLASMVPEGLVLLTSMAFAASVLRLARQRVVVQDLAAVEILARVDVVCVDKTGTLTEPELEVAEIRRLTDATEPIELVLGAFAHAESRPNATLRAIAATCAAGAYAPVASSVPFASARKWSAVELDGGDTWMLGAPDVLLPAETPVLGLVAEEAARGFRVVVLARSVQHRLAGGELPPDRLREAVALVLLAERIRPGVTDTLAYFASQGVTVKVISGDHPATVAGVARRVGLAVSSPLDARTVAADVPVAELAALLEATSVVGRVSPDQKRRMISALQANGHVVAMTGDGVNDVLALKQADLGVAMGSGSAAARTVAPVVLGNNSFTALPAVVAEGRRVIGNIERVANLFVTKTVYASFLALAVGVAQLPFPFLPRHLTIISSLTIGVPAFFLALAPYAEPARRGFERRVAAFAIPAGLVAGIVTLAAFAVARTGVAAMVHARTVATVALFLIGLRLLSVLARSMTPLLRSLLVAAMATAFALILALAPLRSVFGLELPALLAIVEAGGVVALGLVLLELVVVRPHAER